MQKKIKGIVSERAHDKLPSFQIVTKWENIIGKELNLPIITVKRWASFIFRQLNSLKLTGIFLLMDSLRPVKNYYLYFIMTATPLCDGWV